MMYTLPGSRSAEDCMKHFHCLSYNVSTHITLAGTVVLCVHFCFSQLRELHLTGPLLGSKDVTSSYT